VADSCENDKPLSSIKGSVSMYHSGPILNGTCVTHTSQVHVFNMLLLPIVGN
jgi:hypothetical protein